MPGHQQQRSSEKQLRQAAFFSWWKKTWNLPNGLSTVQSPVAPLKVFSGGWWNTMAVSCKHAMSTLVLSLGLMWATSSAPLGSDGNQHDIHTLLLHLKCLELHRMLTNRKWHGSGSFSSNEWQTIIRVRGFARFHQYVDYFHLLSF